MNELSQAKEAVCMPLCRFSKAREGPRQRELLRWMKFNLVGAIGIGVQLAVLAVCRLLGGHYLAGTALAVESAVIHNFLWHERFTWADRPAGNFTATLGRLLRFNLSNGLVSLVGNLVLMRLLVGHFRLNYMLSNLVAVAVCAVANFILSNRFVFQNQAPAMELEHEKIRMPEWPPVFETPDGNLAGGSAVQESGI